MIPLCVESSGRYPPITGGVIDRYPLPTGPLCRATVSHPVAASSIALFPEFHLRRNDTAYEENDIA